MKKLLLCTFIALFTASAYAQPYYTTIAVGITTTTTITIAML